MRGCFFSVLFLIVTVRGTLYKTLGLLDVEGYVKGAVYTNWSGKKTVTSKLKQVNIIVIG